MDALTAIGVSVAAVLAAVLVALAVDHWLGEPAGALHPVVWMGGYLNAVGEMFAPAHDTGRRDNAAFWQGTLAWCAGAMLFTSVAWLLQSLILPLGSFVAALLLGLLLKPMLAWRMLRHEVAAVEAALAVSLDAGRTQLARLVSRDVSQLSAQEVRESAIESLAENLNDSVVAPVFWFVVAGLPGAVLYRFANTADAMWGYRGMRSGRYWEWAGKWAARADDVLSWVPARITALALRLAAPEADYAGLRAQAALTPSPNGGWPMAAMALALGVQLRKPGVYLLNARGRAVEAADTPRAIALAWRALAIAGLLCVAALLARESVRSFA